MYIMKTAGWLARSTSNWRTNRVQFIFMNHIIYLPLYMALAHESCLFQSHSVYLILISTLLLLPSSYLLLVNYFFVSSPVKRALLHCLHLSISALYSFS